MLRDVADDPRMICGVCVSTGGSCLHTHRDARVACVYLCVCSCAGTFRHVYAMHTELSSVQAVRDYASEGSAKVLTVVDSCAG